MTELEHFDVDTQRPELTQCGYATRSEPDSKPDLWCTQRAVEHVALDNGTPHTAFIVGFCQEHFELSQSRDGTALLQHHPFNPEVCGLSLHWDNEANQCVPLPAPLHTQN